VLHEPFEHLSPPSLACRGESYPHAVFPTAGG
jgi:hypothetical protein